MSITEEDMHRLIEAENTALGIGFGMGQNMMAMVLARIAAYAFAIADGDAPKEKKAASLELFKKTVLEETEAMVDAIRSKHDL